MKKTYIQIIQHTFVQFIFIILFQKLKLDHKSRGELFVYLPETLQITEAFQYAGFKDELLKDLERKMNNCVGKIKENPQFKNLEPQILSLKNSLFYVLSKDELSKIEKEYDKIKVPIKNFMKKEINNNNLNNK